MKWVFSICIVIDIDSIYVSIIMYIIVINFKKDLNYELKFFKCFFVVWFCFNDFYYFIFVVIMDVFFFDSSYYIWVFF